MTRPPLHFSAALAALGLACLLQGQAPSVQRTLYPCGPVLAPAGGTYDSTTLSGWTAAAVTLALGNSVRSPDCTYNASKITEDGTSAVHDVNVNVPSTWLAQATMLTVYSRVVNGNRFVVPSFFSSTLASATSVGVNIKNCVQAGAPVVSGTWTGASATITKQQNGWCKTTLTATIAADTSLFIILYMSTDGTNASYAGDSVSTNSYWGVDLR